MLFNLFALTNDPAKRVVRFELSQEVQNELTTSFEKQEETFDDVEELIEFDEKYKPDYGEILYIEDFDDINDLQSAVENPLSVDTADATEESFYSIKALFTGYKTDNEDIKIMLQNFDKRKVLSTNGLSIFHSANVYKKIEGIGLTVDHKIAATLKGKKLTFFSFHQARQIFDLSLYYKEATDEDVIEFAEQDVIEASDTAHLLEMSDTWVRRKISLIQQSGILSDVPINEMKAVAIEFNVPLKTKIENDEEVILLPQNKPEFKKILRFLDEDYYKSPLSKTNFIANSKRALKKQN